MAGTNSLANTVEALFKGMDGIVSTKTVVGDAIKVDNVTILPLIDVSFGIGAGEFDGEKKEKGGGKNQDTITKLLDMVPELLDKFTTPKEDKVTEADVSEMLDSVEK